MSVIRFNPEDLTADLPPPGWYPARIGSCRWRESAAGNRMIQVVFVIEGAKSVYARLAEYFVLDEEATSHLAASLARRRLAALWWAAGLVPQAGDAISPRALEGAWLEIEIQPELWQGQTRYRVVRHRPLAATSDEPRAADFTPPSKASAS